MKKAWPFVLAFALGLGVGGATVIKFRKAPAPDPQYWVDRGLYDAAVADVGTRLDQAIAMIQEAAVIITEKDEDLAARETRIDELEQTSAGIALERDALETEAAVLKTEAAAVIEANPAIRALVANYDLRLSAADRQVFSLSALVEEERAAKLDWAAKYEAADAQYRESWAAYEREHALRLMGDDLRLSLEKQSGGKFWKAVGKGSALYFGIKGDIKLAQVIFKH